MARFISLTKHKQTSAAEVEEIVFINIELISTATYTPHDGRLSLTVHGSRNNTGAVEAYILDGQEATDALKVLREAR